MTLFLATLIREMGVNDGRFAIDIPPGELAAPSPAGLGRGSPFIPVD